MGVAGAWIRGGSTGVIMDGLTGAVVFFDIGNTLASVSISASGDRIDRLAVYPYVPGVLVELRERGARLGIISNRGDIPAEKVNQALHSAGLWDFFEPELIVYGAKDSPRIFERAAAQAGTPDSMLFVGEDAAERAQAVQAGFLVAPHPRLALPVLEHRASLRYVRITVPQVHARKDWRAELRGLPLLPLHVTGDAGGTVYAITTSAAAARLDDLGFWVDRLGIEGEPFTSDLYLLRDDRQLRSGFLTFDGNSTDFFEAAPDARSILASTEEGLIVAVSAGSSVEDYHFSGAQHGHNLKLVPSAALIGTFDDLASAEARVAAAAVAPTAAEQQILDSRIQAEHLSSHVERYAATEPAATNGAVIKSRHILHPDNVAAVTALVEDLERIGGGRFAVRRHRFTHEGRLVENVEAELAGRLDGVVLVTVHMDSTAARQTGYQPALDPAPGADDDASGIAGVLTAADAIGALDATLGAPHRTVRFVLFNAEEHGLVGSRAYARDEAALGTPIIAVFQMDMIGYDVLPERTFELHAGFTPSRAVQERSLALAQMIAELIPQVSPALSAPQVYPTGDEPDPAERRSDHSSFQMQGFTACLASEDLFAGPGSDAPPAERNPNYHLPTDAVINPGYAGDIARAVTAAAWIAATQ
jgi:bacterial leucyl aminopeptidase